MYPQNFILSPSVYRKVCNYLNHECIDELVEDWEDYISEENYEASKKKLEVDYKAEQIKFIKQRLIEIDDQKLKKDEIIDQLRKDFYRKYNFFPERIVKLRGNYFIQLEFTDAEQTLTKKQLKLDKKLQGNQL